jgi:hypothetical protein
MEIFLDEANANLADGLPLRLLLLLLNGLLVGRFLGRRFSSQLEFRSRRVILDLVVEIPRAGQRLAAVLRLTAGDAERRRGSKTQQQISQAMTLVVDALHGPPPSKCFLFLLIYPTAIGRRIVVADTIVAIVIV